MQFFKSTVLALAVGATTLATMPAAQAGDGWRHHRSYHGSSSRSGDLVAAGVLGLAVGAIAAGIATAPRDAYREPYATYREPVRRPRPVRPYPVPEVIYADGQDYGAIEPWTRDWYAYCSARYRSFEPRSGTYTGYDGIRRFCDANR
jgi:hypothetical protein